MMNHCPHWDNLIWEHGLSLYPADDAHAFSLLGSLLCIENAAHMQGIRHLSIHHQLSAPVSTPNQLMHIFEFSPLCNSFFGTVLPTSRFVCLSHVHLALPPHTYLPTFYTRQFLKAKGHCILPFLAFDMGLNAAAGEGWPGAGMAEPHLGKIPEQHWQCCLGGIIVLITVKPISWYTSSHLLEMPHTNPIINELLEDPLQIALTAALRVWVLGVILLSR